MAPKVAGIPALGISGLPFENPKTKWHLGASPMAKHRIYYKGEGGESCEFVFARGSSVHQNAPTMH
jgi:hypothetical protein